MTAKLGKLAYKHKFIDRRTITKTTVAAKNYAIL